MRLTNDKTAEDLRRINDGLREVSPKSISPSHERYVKLADYERIAETPEELREYISRLIDRKHGKCDERVLGGDE